jgi:hypothetical protein
MCTTSITNSHPYFATKKKKKTKKNMKFHAPHIAQFLGNNLFKASLLPLKLVQVFKNEKIASNCEVNLFF